jgi:hypothetical protein
VAHAAHELLRVSPLLRHQAPLGEPITENLTRSCAPSWQAARGSSDPQAALRCVLPRRANIHGHPAYGPDVPICLTRSDGLFDGWADRHGLAIHEPERFLSLLVGGMGVYRVLRVRPIVCRTIRDLRQARLLSGEHLRATGRPVRRPRRTSLVPLGQSGATDAAFVGNVGEWASGVDAFAHALTALRGERSVRVGRHSFARTSGSTCSTSVVPTLCVMRASSIRVRAAVCHGPRMMPYATDTF